MNIAIESTDRVIEIEGHDGMKMPARVWEGFTANGVPVQCLIVRIAAPVEYNQEDFEKDLAECKPPRMHDQTFPLRMIL
jgi:hypothetical protein